MLVVGTEPSNQIIDVTATALQLEAFSQERDWEQFHNPKNISMALAAETGELLELLQWLTPEESSNPSPEQKLRLAEELADIVQYAIRMSDLLDIDLSEALGVRGSAAKRPHLDESSSS